MLEGVASLYPGRILKSPPAITSAVGRTARVEHLPRGIVYIWLYTLNQGMDRIHQNLVHDALIIDLRYVGSTIDEAMALTQALSPISAIALETTECYFEERAQPPALAVEALKRKVERTIPIIFLVNRNTSGPVEATLDALQSRDEILAVGENTAGMTGRHEETSAQPPYFEAVGEIRVRRRPTLIGTGFQPRVLVAVDAAWDYHAYHSIEQGTELSEMVSFHLRETDSHSGNANVGKDNGDQDPNSQSNSGGSPQNVTGEDSGDPVLQRAINIIVALQALGTVPRSF